MVADPEDDSGECTLAFICSHMTWYKVFFALQIIFGLTVGLYDLITDGIPRCTTFDSGIFYVPTSHVSYSTNPCDSFSTQNSTYCPAKLAQTWTKHMDSSVSIQVYPCNQFKYVVNSTKKYPWVSVPKEFPAYVYLQDISGPLYCTICVFSVAGLGILFFGAVFCGRDPASESAGRVSLLAQLRFNDWRDDLLLDQSQPHLMIAMHSWFDSFIGAVASGVLVYYYEGKTYYLALFVPKALTFLWKLRTVRWWACEQFVVPLCIVPDYVLEDDELVLKLEMRKEKSCQLL